MEREFPLNVFYFSQCKIKQSHQLNIGMEYWEMEEGMATHSVFLPGESPRAEEPGGLQSMGLQRVKHDGDMENSTALRNEERCGE